MTKIAIAVVRPDLSAWSSAFVDIHLVDAGAGGAIGQVVAAGTLSVQCDTDGLYTIDLPPNEDIVDPTGTCYAFSVRNASPSAVRAIVVPQPNGSGDSEVPYSWADPTIQVANPLPPTFIPAPTSGTAGQVLGITDTGNGKKWEPIDLTGGGLLELLDPVTASGPSTSAGTEALLSLGSDPTPYSGNPLAPEPIPAFAWDGQVIAGQIRSTVGSSFPSAGFDYRVRVWFGRRVYDETGTWYEATTVHSYTLGDNDELHDWWEVAALHDDPDLGTLRVGWNGRLNGETTEYEWSSTARPLHFNTWHDLRMTMDPATAEITVWVDGVLIESGTPVGAVSGLVPSTPCTVSTPDSGADVMVARGSVLVESMTLTEHESIEVLVAVDAVDGTDGVASFSSHGRTWESWGGLPRRAFTSRRLLSGSWSNPSDSFNIAAADSFTWVLSGVRFPWDLSLYPGSLWWERNAAAVIGTGSGWGLITVPGSIPFAFGITDDGAGAAVVATADDLPPGPCTVAAVLDRGSGELQLYIADDVNGPVLAATADASALGAVVTDSPAVVSVLEWAGMVETYRRALTPAEIMFRHLDAETGTVPVAAVGGAVDDSGWSVIGGTSVQTALDSTDAALGARITKATGTAKGSLIGFTGSGTPSEVTVGADGTVPLANSHEPAGVGYYAPGSTHAFASGVFTPNAPFVATTLALSADRLYGCKPFLIRKRRTFDRIGLMHTAGVATTGVIRIDLAGITEVDGLIGERLFGEYTLDITSTGASVSSSVVKTSGSISLTLDPGIYYPRVVAQFTGTGPTVNARANDYLPVYPDAFTQGAGNTMPIQTSVTGAIPSLWTPNSSVNTSPVVYLRAA